MANRNQQPLGGQRPLLPAPGPRTTTDGIMRENSNGSVNGIDGVQSKALGKSTKRAKVTAVACQPCQKRKSKCNGQRPTCSACSTKRTETDCHYDSTNDQRRTTSLKERIDAGEQEIRDLKMIIHTMCADPSTVELVRDRLVLNNFDHTHDIAQMFRAHGGAGETTATTQPPNDAIEYSSLTTALEYDEFTAFQGPSYSQPSFLSEVAAPSPTATAQSDWSGAVSGEEREELDYLYDGPYPLPGAPSWP